MMVSKQSARKARKQALYDLYLVCGIVLELAMIFRNSIAPRSDPKILRT